VVVLHGGECSELGGDQVAGAIYHSGGFTLNHLIGKLGQVVSLLLPSIPRAFKIGIVRRQCDLVMLGRERVRLVGWRRWSLRRMERRSPFVKLSTWAP
jgi:hypothetical protein